MSSTIMNKQWIYSKRPSETVSIEHYQLRSEKLSTELAANEILIRNHYISVDPYMRIQQSANNSWEAPHPLNTLQKSAVVGRVIKSTSPLYNEGDWVGAYQGWEQYSVVHQNELTKLDEKAAPVTSSLGILGMPGRTAWFGLMDIGKPHPGETVFVSGASGAVGSLVVQFAKKAGCKVVAFASSVGKCQWLRDCLKADVVINYNNFEDDLQLSQYLQSQQLLADVYFDNVGGMITDAVMPNINLRARVIVCGQMSQYNGQLDEVAMGPRFLHHVLYKRATIQGILARDYTHRMDEMITKVLPWVQQGNIIFDETIVDGFEQLPNHLASLFNRSSHGKLIVRIY